MLRRFASAIATDLQLRLRDGLIHDIEMEDSGIKVGRAVGARAS